MGHSVDTADTDDNGNVDCSNMVNCYDCRNSSNCVDSSRLVECSNMLSCEVCRLVSLLPHKPNHNKLPDRIVSGLLQKLQLL